MSPYQERCEELTALLDRLGECNRVLQAPSQDPVLAQLRHDIAANIYTVVVVGEFKRGKSTLLNALLGEALLPADVTPTTATVNVLRYSPQPLLRIHRADGIVEDAPLVARRLQDFVANGAFDPAAIEYLEIGIPHPLLANGLVYVDTPGVEDLNQQRGAITYQFVPRADAVLFVLDATAPVRRTEQDFLDSTILRNGIERLIFLANFSDMVDEEEREQLRGLIERRLCAALGTRQYPVFLISARQALEAILEGDEARLQGSGLPAIVHLLQQLQQSGPGSEEKLQRFVQRAISAARAIQQEVGHAEQVAAASDDELEVQLRLLDAAIQQRDRNRVALSEWVRGREHELLAMTRKSLATFATALRDEVEDAVQSYKGPDFKDFAENRIPKLIRKRCKDWVEVHAGPINSLLCQLERQLTLALSREFQTQVTGTTVPRGGTAGSDLPELTLQAQDVSNSTLVAGLVTGGAATLLMVFGGPVFMPLLSMAGFPFLQRTLLERQLADAKARLLPELRQRLGEVLTGLASDVLTLVKRDIQTIYQAADAKFEEKHLNARSRLQREMELRRGDRASVVEQRARLAALQTTVADIERSITALTTRVPCLTGGTET